MINKLNILKYKIEIYKKMRQIKHLTSNCREKLAPFCFKFPKLTVFSLQIFKSLKLLNKI